jgi:hypothetical protein
VIATGTQGLGTPSFSNCRAFMIEIGTLGAEKGSLVAQESWQINRRGSRDAETVRTRIRELFAMHEPPGLGGVVRHFKNERFKLA